ncbi:hypothetical protein GGX14DRAFT_594655 [Mycena pura]|uniref:Uncharacterized protein n=1 Tax=Mycena pura TaxID=153505 RepID=A0AAD6VNH3_9AGAR|nr:hypothetical protein GGX14DRAFT_594655 [Mycena pura]
MGVCHGDGQRAKAVLTGITVASGWKRGLRPGLEAGSQGQKFSNIFEPVTGHRRYFRILKTGHRIREKWPKMPIFACAARLSHLENVEKTTHLEGGGEKRVIMYSKGHEAEKRQRHTHTTVPVTYPAYPACRQPRTVGEDELFERCRSVSETVNHIIGISKEVTLAAGGTREKLGVNNVLGDGSMMYREVQDRLSEEEGALSSSSTSSIDEKVNNVPGDGSMMYYANFRTGRQRQDCYLRPPLLNCNRPPPSYPICHIRVPTLQYSTHLRALSRHRLSKISTTSLPLSFKVRVLTTGPSPARMDGEILRVGIESDSNFTRVAMSGLDVGRRQGGDVTGELQEGTEQIGIDPVTAEEELWAFCDLVGLMALYTAL